MIFILVCCVVIVLTIAVPLLPMFVGVMLGIRGERRKTLAYLRGLDETVAPQHLATRIAARAHLGWDVKAADDFLSKR